MPRALGYLGVAAGVAGLLTVVPVFEVLGAVEALGLVFGLGLVAWFTWLGVVLPRTRDPELPGARGRSSTRAATPA